MTPSIVTGPYPVGPENLAATMNSTFGQSSHRPRKLFIQMSGAPGSGKSTTEWSSITTLSDPPFLNTKSPLNEAAKLAYDLGWALAENIINQERSVIIDSPCNYKDVLDQGTALAQQYRYDYWYVDLLDERLRKRVPLRSQRTGVDRPPPDASGARHSEDPRALFKRWIKSPCRPDGNAIVVDSTGSPEKRRDYILDRISKQSCHPEVLLS